jgi:Spy/CpxP family protein refolding chaperone
MNRIFLTSMVSISIFAIAVLAQEKHGGAAQNGLPTVEEQIKVLSEKLDLTPEQRIRVKPILRQLHDATLRILEDRSLSRDERLAQVRPQRLLADKKIREILTVEQKKKLDAYEAGPHPEMHGTLTGTPKP